MREENLIYSDKKAIVNVKLTGKQYHKRKLGGKYQKKQLTVTVAGESVWKMEKVSSRTATLHHFIF